MTHPSVIAMRDEEDAAENNKVGGAWVEEPYWYLAGPMSNRPSFNFPRFNEVAGTLREQGYNLVNPAELDHEIARAIKESHSGSHRELTEALAEEGIVAPTWQECLKRDIEIVSDDNCLGIICLEEWEHSEGAQFETYVAYKYRKPIYAYFDTHEEAGIEQRENESGPVLIAINRREALTDAGVED